MTDIAEVTVSLDDLRLLLLRCEPLVGTKWSPSSRVVNALDRLGDAVCKATK